MCSRLSEPNASVAMGYDTKTGNLIVPTGDEGAMKVMVFSVRP